LYILKTLNKIEAVLTFYEHPEEVGEVEVMKENNEDDAGRVVLLHGYLWRNNNKSSRMKRTAEVLLRLSLSVR
jgi:hypothetical protein